MPRVADARTEPPQAWLVIGVVLVALAAAALILPNDFAQDDLSLLVASQHFADFSHLRQFLTEPFWPPPAAPDQYRPLHSILLTVQSVLGAGAPAVFRSTSVLLYAGACLGVFVLARRWLGTWPASAAAVLFAAHPLHVEATALAVAQNELLAALLMTLAVSNFLDARVRDGGLRPLNWMFIGGVYAVALLLNESAIVLPLLIVAASASRLSPRGQATARSDWPGYLMFAVIAVAYVALRTVVLDGAVAAPVVAEAIRDRGIGGRALTMLTVVPHWLRLFLWPARLRADYSPQVITASTGFGLAEITGLVILVGAAVLAWRVRRNAPSVTFGLAWCGITLLPVSNLIPGAAVISERTLFIPSIGVLIAIAGAGAWLVGRMAGQPLASRRSVAVMVGALCLLGVARSLLRERDWRNASALIGASLRDSPRSWMAQQSYGDLLFDGGTVFEATKYYERAIALAPEPWRVRNRLGVRLRMIDNDFSAANQFRKSLAEAPGQMETVVQLAAALISLGNYEEARRLADSAMTAGTAPPSLVTMRGIADTAILQKARPGMLRVPIPR